MCDINPSKPSLLVVLLPALLCILLRVVLPPLDHSTADDVGDIDRFHTPDNDTRRRGRLSLAAVPGALASAAGTRVHLLVALALELLVEDAGCFFLSATFFTFLTTKATAQKYVLSTS